MDDRFTAAHASGYLDGQLPEAGRRRIERHATVCPQCRTPLASLRRMINILPRLAAPPSTGVADGVLERLRLDA